MASSLSTVSVSDSRENSCTRRAEAARVMASLRSVLRGRSFLLVLDQLVPRVTQNMRRRLYAPHVSKSASLDCRDRAVSRRLYRERRLACCEICEGGPAIRSRPSGNAERAFQGCQLISSNRAKHRAGHLPEEGSGWQRRLPEKSSSLSETVKRFPFRPYADRSGDLAVMGICHVRRANDSVPAAADVSDVQFCNSIEWAPDGR
jgi:hypothetical protein